MRATSGREALESRLKPDVDKHFTDGGSRNHCRHGGVTKRIGYAVALQIYRLRIGGRRPMIARKARAVSDTMTPPSDSANSVVSESDVGCVMAVQLAREIVPSLEEQQLLRLASPGIKKRAPERSLERVR
jgi:hypothetical protein